ncbi:hypothetical protein HBH56_112300 [Parastagonospora nodorum]|uniref:Cylicin I n=2 Tax=Phaeosphaeria nodorum (strain SN15 / ATCC MYA-4574 / FGSC 10173) TaxID=321614 RepID=A0A7U2FE79_PHANO|nr:hypothetical protein SNOG_10273 [Parastagonospora nodorum SN15]KAH3913147.1 hypothetical protein HBH56_112300 [Parastagonospora nodorum]EAT82608.1 hypothetical protein SNOG_10273 [Parastagonospora nodorum SN15]KAH3925479.1 hypothetical protein HBH54_178030 [Parastagonospora nodorum]KAH3951287.1 hypothetical protein HBH53_067980 [Parastagonospora nodorum]KAH3979019.1 hypothetical protein HBH52_098240 [Parastagonospora nodorum]
MSFLRSSALRASSLARAARPVRSIRSAELQPWQRAVQRRTYASEHGAHGATQSSEVPWMVAAAAGTATGLYLVFTQDLGHGSGHDEDHHAEAHETHGKNEGQDGDEESGKEESSDEGEDKSQGGPKDEAKSKTKNPPPEERNTEQPEDPSKPGSGKPDKKKSDDSSGDAPKNDEDSPSPDKHDKADPRGKPKSTNHTSGKQEGLSNSDTHHSSQISKQDDKSKKGEGVAETAKLKGTVSTNRPGAENKEERGKAQIDKDA